VSLDRCLEHLRALVSCDTQNPPRHIDGDSEIFAYCREALGSGFQVRTWDHGEGHVSWLALKGRPSLLFNVHLDTVPVGEGWSTDPHALTVSDGRAWGRGACDIKGAAAALLELARQGAENLALLFTSDEEGAGGCCVSRFLESGEAERFRQVVVAEPTSCRAVLGPRGFLSVKMWFHGRQGHSSEARALWDNANHQLARWAAAALQVAESKKTSAGDSGTCLNIGLIEGGTKSNVIAGSAFVHWSARLRPGESSERFLDEIRACAAPGSEFEWEVPFRGEPLPAHGRDDGLAREFCHGHSLDIGDPVDFWTEAALFSAAGLPVVVLGPGDIAQAHQTDEWVALSELHRILGLYDRLVRTND